MLLKSLLETGYTRYAFHPANVIQTCHVKFFAMGQEIPILIGRNRTIPLIFTEHILEIIAYVRHRPYPTILEELN